MNIFVNLLAGTDGGQITRAKAFLDRIEQFYPNIHLIILKDQSVLGEYENTEARTVINVKIGARHFKALTRMIWENVMLPRLMKKHDPDLFLTFSHYLPFPKLGVPSIVGVSNLAPFSDEFLKHETLFKRFRIYLLKKTIINSTKKANAVLALSEVCKKKLTIHGVDSKKIFVSHNGIDTKWRNTEPGLNFIEQENIRKPYILYVSHFYRYKNHRRLIDAFNRFQKKHKSNCNLVLVGKPKNQSYFQEVFSYVEKNNKSNKIQIVPGVERENLKCLYQNTELFIFPSLVENSPNILLEAMMSGAAIAASSQEPMPEHCGDVALYFDGYQTSEIEKVINDALSDPKMLDKMRVKSLRQASHFSWDCFTSDLIKQIELISLNK